MSHIPVMLEEVLDTMAPAAGDRIVDGTFGGGSYTRALLAASDCQVIGIDRDPDAVARGRELAEIEPRFTMVDGAFGDLDALVEAGGAGPVSGVVLDIGVSSYQLDQGERGFSFRKEGPLDMRMSKAGASAADVVNRMDERDLANLIFRFGEDRRSRVIARAIVERRKAQAFETTDDLASVVEAAVGGRRGDRIHPATRTFQAIRMYVNDELGELARGLSAAETVLSPGGRLVVVAFHSLEDRIVKTFFREAEEGARSTASRHMPEARGPVPSRWQSVERRKVSEAEAAANPRSRSAVLRAGTRTSEPARPNRDGYDAGLPDLDSLEVS